MKKNIKLLCWAITFMALNGCLVLAPHQGGFGYGTYTYPVEGSGVSLKNVTTGNRKGSACIQGDSIIPFFYHNWRGDSSIRAAAANGGIKTIHSISREYRKPIFGSVQICTIVFGE